MEYSGRTQGRLPLEAYTSDEWYHAEQQHLFGALWQFGGFEEDVAEPGDFITVQAGVHPLFVMRAPDGSLKAFHNICRHRGTQLLRTVGKSKKSIVCPYHHWTYSLDGDLKSVPGRQEQFPELDLSTLCLHRAQAEVWNGLIFVHPDPAAVSLLHWLAPIIGEIGPHRPAELVEYTEGRTRHVIASNWKIVAENYIDGYHLAHLHSETLSMYDHRSQKSCFAGPHYLFFEPLSSDYRDNLRQRAPLPVIDHGEQDETGAWVPLLFPNLGISATESTWSTFHIIPTAPDETIVETRTRVMPVSGWEYTKQSIRALWNWKQPGGRKFAGSDNDPLASGDFMTEDIYACEQQFRAMRSPKFEVGAMAATMEQSILEYQSHILNHVHPDAV